MSTPRVSVVICTHNPRAHYIARVLAALQAQTLPREDWELLLIDNASAEPLADSCDLSWHSSGRHLRENELGLTPARLRAIAEAKGDLLVFVDDDNVLAADYLKTAAAIASGWPLIGAWGGTIIGEFEAQPEPWMEPLLPLLGIRKFPRPIWSNNPEDVPAQPCGAGLCVRLSVARAYAAQVLANPLRRRLGRTGQQLTSGEDNDLIHTTCDLGLGFGNFPQLLLTHLIPARRLTQDYLIRLVEGIVTSGSLLQFYRSGVLPQKPGELRTAARYLLTWLTQDRRRAMIYRATQNGKSAAAHIARNLSAARVGADL